MSGLLLREHSAVGEERGRGREETDAKHRAMSGNCRRLEDVLEARVSLKTLGLEITQREGAPVTKWTGL